MTIIEGKCLIFHSYFYRFWYLFQNQLSFLLYYSYLFDFIIFFYDSIAEFREAIHLTFQNLQRPMILVNITQRITKMYQYCLSENGGHFQHHLKKPVCSFPSNDIFCVCYMDTCSKTFVKHLLL